ncbi:CDP-alcohol phosphatidyltransferase family protein [Cellulomonas alba]|uniref:CDP-alcohol phosphatidyltransferase family protein n=1 Tax=Cellulomonas alba TaxID=3053467 RepID=A0ABT7SJA5_9CELL|nr:CDP-alcohol phosphatidyltransferase family protein [Cellulomonas alba]MDM7856271.1 CDP-alcohol phosphatidyltransferase family protein [Cellulomonas alba]
MRTGRGGPAVAPVAVAVVLASLALTAGLSLLGWVVGLACAAAVAVVEARGLARYARARGPADLVTLLRAVLTCGVAALAADAFVAAPAVGALVGLTVPALALDAVDGWVARRTRTASRFGAWFDGEVDAFLILVLSVDVARTARPWVLAMGAARYAFLLAGRVFPWLRAPLPPRYWRKVVTAAVGIALATAAVGVLPGAVTTFALVLALALLAESFGRDALWLWRRRGVVAGTPSVALARTEPGRAAR